MLEMYHLFACHEMKLGIAAVDEASPNCIYIVIRYTRHRLWITYVSSRSAVFLSSML